MAPKIFCIYSKSIAFFRIFHIGLTSPFRHLMNQKNAQGNAQYRPPTESIILWNKHFNSLYLIIIVSSIYISNKSRNFAK